MSAKPSAKYALITGASRALAGPAPSDLPGRGGTSFSTAARPWMSCREVQREINSHFPGHLYPGSGRRGPPGGCPADI